MLLEVFDKTVISPSDKYSLLCMKAYCVHYLSIRPRRLGGHMVYAELARSFITVTHRQMALGLEY